MKEDYRLQFEATYHDRKVFYYFMYPCLIMESVKDSNPCCKCIVPPSDDVGRLTERWVACHCIGAVLYCFDDNMKCMFIGWHVYLFILPLQGVVGIFTSLI